MTERVSRTANLGGHAGYCTKKAKGDIIFPRAIPGYGTALRLVRWQSSRERQSGRVRGLAFVPNPRQNEGIECRSNVPWTWNCDAGGGQSATMPVERVTRKRHTLLWSHLQVSMNLACMASDLGAACRRRMVEATEGCSGSGGRLGASDGIMGVDACGRHVTCRLNWQVSSPVCKETSSPPHVSRSSSHSHVPAGFYASCLSSDLAFLLPCWSLQYLPTMPVSTVAFVLGPGQSTQMN
jgi:hypothetical protein